MCNASLVGGVAIGAVVANVESGWIRHGAIAVGICTALNSLDGQVYTFGKGPTQTTVTAPKTEIMQGTSIVIEGTVTDQSLAQMGTAAVSDASMSGWMEYLHMQKPIPSDVVGVSPAGRVGFEPTTPTLGG